MTDLDKLIDAVDGGYIDTTLIIDAIDEPLDQIVTLAAYNGSLDAAKALHDALSPDWGWSLNHMEGSIGESTSDALVDAIEPFRCHAANSTSPARAWLIAILKAYRSQVQE